MYVSITLNDRQLNDFELLKNGSFYPLTSFMNKSQYQSCIDNMIIDNNLFFPLPITLCISEEKKNELYNEKCVLLKHETGLNLALIDISDLTSIYKPNIEEECTKVFGCFDTNHPYIQILEKYQKDGLIYNVGGKIIEYYCEIPHYDFEDFRLTPQQCKDFFKKNEWTNVIGFQTRNPMHRSHFELTKYALNQVPESKLFLNPVIGITQDCDIDYHKRVKCYKKLLAYYSPNLVKLSLLSLSMRMAGPKEALLHALIRKNHGCTHFVIGRAHAEPSCLKKDNTPFYEPYEAQDLLIKYADAIGITPIVSQEIVYAEYKNSLGHFNGKYLPINEVDESTMHINRISGTQFRNLLQSKDVNKIPYWYSFPDIIEELRNVPQPGLCLYFIGLSSSGKSTLANLSIDKLKEFTNKHITLLDGDIVRQHLSSGLGFSQKDRSINIRRIGYVASEIVKHGGIVVVANIAPFEEDRQYNRRFISQYGKYIEIFVNTPLEKCEERDPKGLYKLARLGKIKEFTGIDSPFETPMSSDIIINGNDDLKQNIIKVLNKIDLSIL